jgi:hypothetical protein
MAESEERINRPSQYVEEQDVEEEDLDPLYTGEGSSTRGSTFHENPATGVTADEEDGEFVRESLEKRTRRYESG